jgi:molybdopterin biosynthesis enzyme
MKTKRSGSKRRPPTIPPSVAYYLVKVREGLNAYSIGSDSGSITTFARADGFIETPRQTEIAEAGSRITVQILGRTIRPADLIIMR